MAASEATATVGVGELPCRGSAGESFLGDLRRADSGDFMADVRLPDAHSYFNDLTADPYAADPLLVLEVCRQAGRVLGHTAFGVPLDAVFLVTAWQVDVPPAGRRLPAVGPVPARLRIATEHEKRRAGRVRSVRLRMEVTARGETVGRVVIDALYAGAGEYWALRELQRGSPPPRSDRLAGAAPDRPAPGAVPPALVGRSRPENALLAELTGSWQAVPVGPGRADRSRTARSAARLAVSLSHPTLFAPPSDHVTAMILTEAARQLVLADSGSATGATAPRLRVTGLTGSFTRFAELDAPVTLHLPYGEAAEVRAAAGGAGAGDGPPSHDGVPALDGVPVRGGVPVEIRQSGSTIARLTFTTGPVDPAEPAEHVEPAGAAPRPAATGGPAAAPGGGVR